MPVCTALPMGRGNRVFINLIHVEYKTFLSFSLFNCFDMQTSTSQCYGAFYIISATEAKKSEDALFLGVGTSLFLY